MTAQPWHQLVEAEFVAVVERRNESVGLLRIGHESGAVNGEKDIGGGKSYTLIAIEKGMLLCDALPKHGRSA